MLAKSKNFLKNCYHYRGTKLTSMDPSIFFVDRLFVKFISCTFIRPFHTWLLIYLIIVKFEYIQKVYQDIIKRANSLKESRESLLPMNLYFLNLKSLCKVPNLFPVAHAFKRFSDDGHSIVKGESHISTISELTNVFFETKLCGQPAIIQFGQK